MVCCVQLRTNKKAEASEVIPLLHSCPARNRRDRKAAAAFSESAVNGTKIELTRGYSAIVDENSPQLEFKWCAQVLVRGHVYAVRRKNGKYICLHREVMNAKPGEIVDHINRDTLDNRLCNLRLVSLSENLANSKLRRNNTTGHRGVQFSKHAKKWNVRIYKNRKLVFHKYFDTKEEAIKAHREAMLKFYGDVAPDYVRNA